MEKHKNFVISNKIALNGISQTCSESQKVKLSQIHDFDFLKIKKKSKS